MNIDGFDFILKLKILSNAKNKFGIFTARYNGCFVYCIT